MFCFSRCCHATELWSLLIATQCLRWGKQPMLPCLCQRHRFDCLPPYYQGLRGPSQPWLHGNGPLLNILKRDQFSAKDFCQGTMVWIIFKITLYVDDSKHRKKRKHTHKKKKKKIPHTFTQEQAHTETQTYAYLKHHIETSELTRWLSGIRTDTFIFSPPAANTSFSGSRDRIQQLWEQTLSEIKMAHWREPQDPFKMMKLSDTLNLIQWV